MSNTGIIWDILFTKHDMGFGHPESPNRLLAIKQVLDGDGVGKEVKHVEPREATKEEIATVHDIDYIKLIENTAGGEFSYLDADTATNAFTWPAAILAAGSCIVLTQKVCQGELANAFALVRPPGHHAERDRAMGFCIFNNIAIAAKYARDQLNIERIYIIDYDTHHGNGTQQAFYNDERVFYFSVHRGHFYPGTGNQNEIGEAKGKGTTLNVPLEYGATDDDFKQVFDKKLIPSLEEFSPQLIMVSAGFDAHVRDPLGGMRLTTEGYRWIAQTITDLAKEYCQGKMVFTLEGGYDLKALRDSVEATLEVLVNP